MSQEPITVTFTLEEMFSRLEQKIDKQAELTSTVINKLEEKIDKQAELTATAINKLEEKIDKQAELTATAINKLEEKIDTVKDELEGKIDKLEEKVDKLEDKINKQSEEIVGIKSTLDAQQPLIQKIPDLTEKVGELKNWRQIVIITITAIISGSITWVIRGLNIKP